MKVMNGPDSRKLLTTYLQGIDSGGPPDADCMTMPSTWLNRDRASEEAGDFIRDWGELERVLRESAAVWMSRESFRLVQD